MKIASDISETTQFGTTDDLYAVGFTSLTLMKLSAVVFEETGVNLNISKLIDEPTIRKIANEIDNAQKDSEKLELIMGLHDQICESSSIVQWFVALNTKFVTKHTQEVVKLRNLSGVKVGQWLEVVKQLFYTYESFANYQLPLLENTLLELKKICVRIDNGN